MLYFPIVIMGLLLRHICSKLSSSKTCIRHVHYNIKRHLSDFKYQCEQDSGIYALSSGFGKCGVSVIRISGKGTSSALLKLGQRTKLPEQRKATVWDIYHPKNEVQLDRGLVLWFKGPTSFTGEDVCELHVHGGPAVVAGVLDALASIPGLRPAEAGEFTKRAFQNGKLDLTEVEGLGDLIHAETEAQRRQALRQMQGALSELYGGWRTTLVKCVANAEAYIDFSEDDNIEDGVLDFVEAEVRRVYDEIERHLADARRGERLRTGVSVAIVGQPNVGKSSLLNALTQRDTAIVSSIAGTTRDVIEKTLDIGGYPVLLSDTAGLRHSDDIIEQQGVNRARRRAEEADLRILVLDIRDIVTHLMDPAFEFDRFVFQHVRQLGLNINHVQDSEGTEVLDQSFHTHCENMLIVFNKTDLVSDHNVCISIFLKIKNKMFDIKKNDSKGASKKCSTTQQTTDQSNILHKEDTSAYSEREQAAHCTNKNKQSQGYGSGSQDSYKLKVCMMSCSTGEGMEDFLAMLTAQLKIMCESTDLGNPSLTQARHRAHLTKCLEQLCCYNDLREKDIVLATEQLRQALRQLGKITGKVTSDEILDVVFQDFCIGK